MCNNTHAFPLDSKFHLLEEDHEAFYGIADLHALTVATDPAVLRERTLRTAAQLLAAGTGAREARAWIRHGRTLRASAVAPADAGVTPDVEREYQKIMDELHVETVMGQGTTVVMSKRLPPSD